MSYWEIILMGVALSMDAVAVSMTNAMVGSLEQRSKLLMPIMFGLFQAVMPVIGYFAGGLFTSILQKYSGIVVFVILAFLGGKMLKDGLFPGKEEKPAQTDITFKLILIQAVATSIDALGVGIGFSALSVSILPAALIIGVVTALMCTLALLVGKKFGALLGGKASIVGGGILILLAVKALF